MVDNITPNQFPITYEKSSAPEQVINNENIIKTDLASFDCKVGSITNISTNFKAMMPLVEDYEPYKNTLIKITIILSIILLIITSFIVIGLRLYLRSFG